MTRNWLVRDRNEPSVACPRQAPEGSVIYAIGDIHGRLDLLNQILVEIERDLESTGAVARMVFLGDYVDRGPNSRGVIDRVAKLRRALPDNVVALKGNHEDMFLSFLSDPTVGPTWVMHGGRETLMSYGVQAPRQRNDTAGWLQTQAALAEALPADHLEFFKSLSLSYVAGDYVFVHAGVRPGVAMEEQTAHDLLWIRRPFLDVDEPIDRVVVHGHSANTTPKVTSGRIGIDTGAYATGVLTALRLHGEDQRFLRTGVATRNLNRAPVGGGRH